MTEANVKVDDAATSEVVDDKATSAEQTGADANGQQQGDQQAAADQGQSDKAADGTGDAADDKPSAIPDNWRQLGLDGAGLNKEQRERADKLVSRYGSLGGVIKALVEKDDMIRSGKLRRDMPDPKDEKAMAEWRKDQGIPADPTGYQLSDTVTKRLVDADKPILSSFTEFAHAKNLPSSAVDVAAEWYVGMQEQAAEHQTAEDTEAAEACEDAMRDNWSRDEFKGNRALATRFMEGAGGIGADWTEARLPDGRKLGNIPDFVMWASDRGREQFGDSVFASADGEARHSSRKAEIEKIRDTDFDRYEAEGLDKEYRQIIEKDLKRTKR